MLQASRTGLLLHVALRVRGNVVALQSELKAAGERAQEAAQRLAKLEEAEAEARTSFAQALEEAESAQGEARHLAGALAERESDLQVRTTALHMQDCPLLLESAWVSQEPWLAQASVTPFAFSDA